MTDHEHLVEKIIDKLQDSYYILRLAYPTTFKPRPQSYHLVDIINSPTIKTVNNGNEHIVQGHCGKSVVVNSYVYSDLSNATQFVAMKDMCGNCLEMIKSNPARFNHKIIDEDDYKEAHIERVLHE